MTAGNSGRGGRRKEGGKISDQFKDACPPHKIKDLDSLVKTLKGDEEKIRAQISEWWDEPVTEEPQWEDVNKKALKGKVPQKGGGYKGGRGDRGDGGGRGSRERGGRGEAGRGFSGRGGGGGRGGGPGRREGRGGRGKERRPVPSEPVPDDTEPVVVAEAPPPADPLPSGAPAPVVNPPRPTGAWGKPAARAAPAAAPPAAPEVTVEKAAPEPVAMPPPEPKAEIKNTSLDIGIATPQDPTPSGEMSNNGAISANGGAPKPVGGGNVWATKGSAHLINAEKPKPPGPGPESDLKEAVPESKPKRSRDRRGKRAPQSQQEEPAADIASITPASDMIVPQGPAEVELEPVAPAAEYIDSSIGVSVNGTNAWASSQTDIQASPVGPISVTSSSVPEMSMNLVNEAPPVTVSPEKASPPSISANVLNMGHWETGDNDESLDFGFGSFGAENDVGSVDEVGAALEAASEAPPAAQPSASPARPPPGLPLSGMPPMPANAVLVHELEGKLENASLGPKSDDQNEKSVESSLANQQPLTSNLSAAPASQMPPHPDMNGTGPQGAMAQNYASAYGMGMYNYNANLAGAANGFPGMGPVLGGGALPPQAKPQQAGGVAPSATLPQQGSLYGAPSSAPTGGLAADSTTVPSADGAPAPGIPPGMPAGMPYNPALYYGQQPYQMGQPHGVSGYGYGYGAQFGGAVQGGFGYQQVMGQSGGYGQPYEEQQPSQQHPNSHHNSHHSGGGNHQGGYQKNNHSGGGGYRGRNNNNQYNNHHHNNQSQYQGQYNAQHQAGYGQQPYGMGYGVDHFNQRGGYGPNNMDPYSMQQNSAGYQSSGIGGAGGFNGQEDSEQPHQGKGKGKGGNSRGFGSNPNMQQFQQGHPQAQQGGAGQQSFGLQGGVGDSTSATAAGAGAGAGGTNSGWSNQSWGGAGWQGNN